MKVKLTESKLKQIVAESVKKVLNETVPYWEYMEGDNYYGGGLPDKFFDDEDDYISDDRITKYQLKELDSFAETIADIANNISDNADLLYQAVECIDEFTSKHGFKSNGEE